ncbi:MAG: methyltransferase domain-containing protein [Proteobacteria bacterium]|nr:methyltransferase domain-containing protein [Pseudomonadota bacterium]
MWFRGFRHFVRPPEEVYRDPALDFMDGYRTYGEYNYLRPGLVSRIKSAHFEKALDLTRDHFGACRVIDFGCADGFFLPSLASHFEAVLAIDRVPMFAEVARRVVSEGGLTNVEVICNEGLDTAALRERIGGVGSPRPRIAFCLEVIEHVGDPGDLYGAKIRLLRDVFSLLEDDGRIVISVPTMVGLPFLLQRAALASLGIWREPMSWRSLLRASFLKDTSELEPHWDGGHLGFNHLRLEEAMSDVFSVEKRTNLGFQVLYVIGPRR